MGARLRSWRQQIKTHPVATVLTALVIMLVVVVILGGYLLHWDWTGFNGDIKSGKTLWDWLQLLASLAIPVVVGFGAVWFTTRQGKVADTENKDNQREAALQAYIDKMSELLLKEKLRDSAEEDEVRKVARVRTLTILPRLDGMRKRSVLQFLYESGLIVRDKSIIDLSDADLSGADLKGADLPISDLRGAFLLSADLRAADLRGADLRGATLMNTDLRDAELGGADLRVAILRDADLRDAELGGANLDGADLDRANLDRANVDGANLTIEQLDKARSLHGISMPDGSIHP